MNAVGTFEAKTHLSALLDRVEKGEEITITRHGNPVARLCPPSANRPDPDELIAQMREIRSRNSLGPYSWKELRDEGRR